jgi:putative NAD(P)H nitroreductase
MELKDVIDKRLSTLEFDPNFHVTKEDINKIIELNRLAPSTYNIQHARYFVIIEKEVKEDFKAKVCPQQKVVDASAVIIIMGLKNAYLEYKGLVSDKKYALMEEYYTRECMEEKDAIRNASLSAMQFMLIAKDFGYDTCPMTGFDFKEVLKFFNLSDDYEPVIMITLGKESVNKPKRRDERRKVEELVTYKDTK